MIYFFILVFIELHFAIDSVIVFFFEKKQKVQKKSYFCKMCLCNNF